ncbi:MAG: recombination mediator RecR [Gammaproteobacteria bacterium]|nr:recombination mediator RecR [Gammaproteobacteria bacterium]
MSLSPLTDRLVEALSVLPGVGKKTAQRMALYLLEHNRKGGLQLAKQLNEAMDKVGHCSQCRIHSEEPVCRICRNPSRNQALVCVVESPADALAVEQSGGFRGVYFVLMGHLSPLDGIGPEQLGIGMLVGRVAKGDIDEIIVATNPTVEGEATAHYIADSLREFAVTVSRIAHGVPVGGELEYTDGGTLNYAFSGRKRLD